jgi:hypothetical protein
MINLSNFIALSRPAAYGSLPDPPRRFQDAEAVHHPRRPAENPSGKVLKRVLRAEPEAVT